MFLRGLHATERGLSTFSESLYPMEDTCWQFISCRNDNRLPVFEISPISLSELKSFLIELRSNYRRSLIYYYKGRSLIIQIKHIKIAQTRNQFCILRFLRRRRQSNLYPQIPAGERREEDKKKDKKERKET